MIRTPETHPLTWRQTDESSPLWFKDYRNKNGYFGAERALTQMSASDVVELIEQSGLRGRGGSGFSTGVKWNLMRQSSGKTRYLVCNADEMEPGTYKDRFLLRRLPHLVLEGIIISAFALQAHCCYVFVRGEYLQEIRNLEKAIAEAHQARFLGKRILNGGFSLKVLLHTGAGRYVCGEETALLNVLEGKRAVPRPKPPFPSEAGLWGKPTCVNNVETLCNVPAIVLHGVRWYRSFSRMHNTQDTGTKLMGVSGKVNNPGLWEVPFGTPARALLEERARGMRRGFVLKSWQPGGASTDFLVERHLDVPMDFARVAQIGSRLGTGIITVVDRTVSMVRLVLNLEKFFARESCGWCTPCRDGLAWIVEILRALKKRRGTPDDLRVLRHLCVLLKTGSTFCAHAPGAVEPLRSALKYFPSEFEAGVSSIHDRGKAFRTNLLDLIQWHP